MKKFSALLSRFLFLFTTLHSLLLLVTLLSKELYGLRYHHSDSFVSDILLYLVPAIAAAFIGPLVRHTDFDSTKHRAVTIAYLSIGLIILLWSQSHWGYYLSRPSIPNSIREVRQLVSALYFRSPYPYNCNLEPNNDPNLDLYTTNRDSYDSKGSRIEYYMDDMRIDEDWREKIKKPAFRLNTAKGIAIHDFIEKNYTFERPEKVYGPCFVWNSQIYEFTNDLGKRIYYVSYSTPQLSNDHYAYYEFIIHENETGYKIHQSNRFFYDVAGVEGLEFPFIMLIFNVLYISASRVMVRMNRIRT
ncbi:hypothetical protein LEP1GSC188_1296 [Leptospira weilii serovar Topaz str. LT2116]|uniref:Uncharacterized protein n=1 Tax=Leptospira weilii serovar Topaz str. LT2116 TaxID=1088540 RepID=M3H489_9LEPT|nr:hypothetical protein LEP1GSC188_1296 [Leptospira weilii serovar Topaz str. LT2116]